MKVYIAFSMQIIHPYIPSRSSKNFAPKLHSYKELMTSVITITRISGAAWFLCRRFILLETEAEFMN